MKQTKRMLCALSALVLAASLMSGCGESSTETAENSVSEAVVEETTVPEETEETEPAETDAADADDKDDADEKETAKTGSSASEPVELSDKQLQEARKVVEQFMDGCKNNDADAILSATNLGDAFKLMLGEEYTEEELKEELAELFDIVESYEIGEGRSDTEALVQYNESVAELLEEAEAELNDEDLEEEDAAEIQMVLDLLKPLDGIAVFPVTVTDTDGTEETEDIYVVLTDGKWTLDLMLVDAMIGYVDTSETYSANNAAKSVYNAMNTSLVDLDSEDVDVLQLDGDYSFTGEDFEDLTRPDSGNGDSAAVMKQLNYKVTLYFADIADLEAISVHFEDGICTAVAVETGDGGFGAYPNPIDEDGDEITSIEDAFAYAQDY